MILNLGTIEFNANVATGGNTPAWGTELGQGEGYRFSFEGMGDFLTSMLYCSVPDLENIYCPLGKGGNRRDDYEFVLGSVYNKVFVNGKQVDNAKFILLIVKQIAGGYHVGRRTLKYNPHMTYKNEELNKECFKKIEATLGIGHDAAWFIDEINVKNQDELHFKAYVLGEMPINYVSASARKDEMLKFRNRKSTLKVMQGQEPKRSKRSLQIIYYGAPGTGKSHKVEEMPGDKIRTTFHPDTDYATFVGCYKPVEKTDNDGRPYITYAYVGQSFTKAYMEAWRRWVAPKKDEDQNYTLVIEEINRGNCAQIFGDIFQLLDRDETGFSRYSIEPDDDLTHYLAEKFSGILEQFEAQGFENIANGAEMKLPPNLSIVATMNTSDQSLFPIDSAFKRRWDWEYIPIQYEPRSKDGNPIAFEIEAGGKRYDWGKFIKAVNDRIYSVTQSEDKELGYFFVQPGKEGEPISMQRFVGKVVFYLWNDIFKDYGNRDESIFKFGEGLHQFNKFFTEQGNIDTTLVQSFIRQFTEEIKPEPIQDTAITEDTAS